MVTTLLKAVNFIKSRGLNHRQFQEFLQETNAEFGGGKMLKRVFDLRKEIAAFT